MLIKKMSEKVLLLLKYFVFCSAFSLNQSSNGFITLLDFLAWSHKTVLFCPPFYEVHVKCELREFRQL